MAPIDSALAAARSCDNPNLTAIANIHNVCRSTLSRRYNKVATTKLEKYENQQLLSKPQERTLVEYINKLSELGLPPTPAMVNHFAFDIVQQQPGVNWCRRFCERWSAQLDSRYLKPLDAARKKVDSISEYKAYFELVRRKIEQYEVLPANTYNMDEKGFLVGFLTKAKRIFSKQAFESKRLLGNLQDGNREWITLIATICADGTAVAPALIYKAVTGDIQDSWVQDLDPTKQLAFFASSPTGWTNDELGFEWLTKVFDRETKAKARNGRDWRLLFVDGHGSHINMRFLDWCIAHRILVAVYPPHSTHRLQPLDVSLFAPLAVYYSQQLDAFLHSSQGLSTITKRDFFRLFWPAFNKTFTEANVLSGWRRTGLHPFEPEVILGIFKDKEQPVKASRPTSSSASSALSASDWRKIRGLLKEVVNEVVDEQDKKKVNKLKDTLLAITTENALLKVQNQGFIQALSNEKKRRKRGRALFEELRAQDGQGATFFSPIKIQQAKDLQIKKDEAKAAQQQQKEVDAEARCIERQLQQEAAAAKRLQRQQAAAIKKAEKAAKASQRQVDKEVQSAARQLQQLLQLSTKKPKRPTKQQLIVKLPVLVLEPPSKVELAKQPASPRGCETRQPQHLINYEV